MTEEEKNTAQQQEAERTSHPEADTNSSGEEQKTASTSETQEGTNEEPSEDTNGTEKSEDSDEPEEPVEMVEVPKKRLEELEKAEAKFMEDLKRERAESINYRKRLQRQRDEFSEIASAQILTKVLVVQDDLKRVLDNAGEEIPTNHLEGIKLVQQRLQGIFDQEGVALINIEEGKTSYDPREMEAVVSQPIDGVAPNTVMGIISNGFKKGDRVLRPAKVMISKSVPKEEPEKESKDASPETIEQPLEKGNDQEETTNSTPDANAAKAQTGEQQ